MVRKNFVHEGLIPKFDVQTALSRNCINGSNYYVGSILICSGLNSWAEEDVCHGSLVLPSRSFMSSCYQDFFFSADTLLAAISVCETAKEHKMLLLKTLVTKT